MKSFFRIIGRLVRFAINCAFLILLLWGSLFLLKKRGIEPQDLVDISREKASQIAKGQSPKEVLLTDDHNSHERGRWRTNQATIYLATEDATFSQAYQEAIANWNQTGAFQFQLVDQPDQAQILAGDMNDGEITAAGLTESQINSLTHYFEKVEVKLNHYYLSNPEFGYGYDRILHTAEHELGHAMGLDHDEGQSVMQSSGSFLGIQDQDVVHLQDIYAQ